MSIFRSLVSFVKFTASNTNTKIANIPKNPLIQQNQDKTISGQAKTNTNGLSTQDNESSLQIAKQSVNNEHKNMAYCHALPNDWDEKKLRSYFDPTSKNISSVKLLKNRIGGYTGRALIQFQNQKVCEEYLKKYSDSFIESTDTLQRIIMKPFELKTKTTRLSVEKTMKEVYLANLPYEATSDEIYALALDFGEVLHIDMPLSFDGQKNRGYCIVRFAKAEQAAKFQRYFDEETLFGRKIRAQVYFYEFDTQKKRVERFSDKIAREDPSIKNANINANKQLFRKLLSQDTTEH